MSAGLRKERVGVGEALLPDAATSTLDRERERFALLYRVGKDVLSTSSADDLYELALSLVFDCLGAERGALLLRDGQDALRPRVLRDRSGGPLTEAELNIPTSIVREAVADEVGILTTDAAQDPRFGSRASVKLGQIRSALCAPLWDGNRVLGVIYLDSRIKTQAFTRDDLLLLNAIANLVAIRLRQETLHAALGRERVLRSNLSRYHSPAVVDAILSRARDSEQPELGLEEREVTVLFADLKDFTALAESVTPAEVADFLNDYYELATAAIFAQGGTVNEYLGDAVMAIFGAPVAQADHALRAVRAALELQRRLGALPDGCGELRSRPQVRIGINSGPVVVGSVGPPERLKYAVIGDAVNVAARLEHLGEPGTITLGEETFDRLGGEVPCVDLGPVQVRGRERPVRAYRVGG